MLYIPILINCPISNICQETCFIFPFFQAYKIQKNVLLHGPVITPTQEILLHCLLSVSLSFLASVPKTKWPKPQHYTGHPQKIKLHNDIRRLLSTKLSSQQNVSLSLNTLNNSKVIYHAFTTINNAVENELEIKIKQKMSYSKGQSFHQHKRSSSTVHCQYRFPSWHKIAKQNGQNNKATSGHPLIKLHNDIRQLMSTKLSSKQNDFLSLNYSDNSKVFHHAFTNIKKPVAREDEHDTNSMSNSDSNRSKQQR